MMRKINLFVLVTTVLILVFLTGCGNKVSEKVSEGIAEKAIGGKVDITQDGIKVQKDGASIETGGDLKWPEGSMGDLPEPKAKITGVVNGKATEGCTVVFSEMSLEDAEAYIAKLKELGYQEGMNLSDANGLTYGGKNSSGASVMISYQSSAKEGTIGFIAGDANNGN